MYEKRCIAFIDILGFGALVEKSEHHVDLQQLIHDALMCLHPQTVTRQAYSRLCVEMIHTEDELQKATNDCDNYNNLLLDAYPVRLNYFSDSIVISSSSEDSIASALIIDLIVRLSIKLWQDHNLLIRGGLTVGNLCHIVNGPLFGPAMNRAYMLESKKAINPRILVDKEYFSCLLAFEHNLFMKHLMSCECGQFYFSLVGAFKYALNTNNEFDPNNEIMYKDYFCAIDTLSIIMRDINEDIIKSKYVWLIEDFQRSYEWHRRYV